MNGAAVLAVAIDPAASRINNRGMSTTQDHLETVGGRAVQEAMDRAMKGVRDPEASRKALERLRRGREEMRQRIGVQEVAVDLIREAREP